MDFGGFSVGGLSLAERPQSAVRGAREDAMARDSPSRYSTSRQSSRQNTPDQGRQQSPGSHRGKRAASSPASRRPPQSPATTRRGGGTPGKTTSRLAAQGAAHGTAQQQQQQHGSSYNRSKHSAGGSRKRVLSAEVATWVDHFEKHCKKLDVGRSGSVQHLAISQALYKAMGVLPTSMQGAILNGQKLLQRIEASNGLVPYYDFIAQFVGSLMHDPSTSHEVEPSKFRRIHKSEWPVLRGAELCEVVLEQLKQQGVTYSAALAALDPDRSHQIYRSDFRKIVDHMVFPLRDDQFKDLATYLNIGTRFYYPDLLNAGSNTTPFERGWDNFKQVLRARLKNDQRGFTKKLTKIDTKKSGLVSRRLYYQALEQWLGHYVPKEYFDRMVSESVVHETVQAATYNNQDKLVEYHRIFVKFGNPHPHASAGFGASFDDEGGGGGGGGASPARFEIQTDRSLASEAEVETYDDAPTVFIDGENMGALDMEPREGMAPMNQTRWLEDPTPEPPAQEAAPGQPGVALQGMLDYTQAGEYEEDEDNTPNSPGAQYGYAATRQQPLQHQADVGQRPGPDNIRPTVRVTRHQTPINYLGLTDAQAQRNGEMAAQAMDLQVTDMGAPNTRVEGGEADASNAQDTRVQNPYTKYRSPNIVTSEEPLSPFKAPFAASGLQNNIVTNDPQNWAELANKAPFSAPFSGVYTNHPLRYGVGIEPVGHDTNYVIHPAQSMQPDHLDPKSQSSVGLTTGRRKTEGEDQRLEDYTRSMEATRTEQLAWSAKVIESQEIRVPSAVKAKDVVALLKEKVKEHYEALLAQFKKDERARGFVTRVQLVRAVERICGVELSKPSITKMLHHFDSSRDGDIKFAQFLLKYGDALPKNRKAPRQRTAPAVLKNRDVTIRPTAINGAFKRNVARNFLTLKDGFQAADWMACGSIPESDFGMCLRQCGFELSRGGLSEIATRWASPDTKGHVAYMDFLRDVQGRVSTPHTRTEKGKHDKRSTQKTRHAQDSMPAGSSDAFAGIRRAVLPEWTAMRRACLKHDPKPLGQPRSGAIPAPVFKNLLREFNVKFTEELFYQLHHFLDPQLKTGIKYDTFFKEIIRSKN